MMMIHPFSPDLYSPRFWQFFMRDLKDGDLQALIKNTGYPATYVVDRLEAFLRGREAELHSRTHPGTHRIQ
jgi:hypothetical protein